MARFMYAIATASWIDARVELQAAVGPSIPYTQLPVNDGVGPPFIVNLTYFKAQSGFRFANFLEVYVDVLNGKVVGSGFTPDSKGYFAPSFMGHKSHEFSTKQTRAPQGNQFVFTQIVGARTTGAEEVGGDVGGKIGWIGGKWGHNLGRQLGKAAARATTPFAPIWSELEISINSTGNASGSLKRFSLFPSLTYYEPVSPAPLATITQLRQRRLPYGPPFYDAGQKSQTMWFKSGWGSLRGGFVGPTPGNPWNINNDGTDRET